MTYYPTCDICEERRIGVVNTSRKIVFCEECGKRELNHNIRMGEKAIRHSRLGYCKFFDVCEYKQENGYTCTHEGEANHYCGKYRELDKR